MNDRQRILRGFFHDRVHGFLFFARHRKLFGPADFAKGVFHHEAGLIANFFLHGGGNFR